MRIFSFHWTLLAHLCVALPQLLLYFCCYARGSSWKRQIFNLGFCRNSENELFRLATYTKMMWATTLAHRAPLKMYFETCFMLARQSVRNRWAIISQFFTCFYLCFLAYINTMVRLFGTKKTRLWGKITLRNVRAYLNLTSDFVDNYTINIVFWPEKIRWIQKNLRELKMFFCFQILRYNFARI